VRAVGGAAQDLCVGCVFNYWRCGDPRIILGLAREIGGALFEMFFRSVWCRLAFVRERGDGEKGFTSNLGQVPCFGLGAPGPKTNPHEVSHFRAFISPFRGFISSGGKISTKMA
jgi:hypothetical protein